MVMLYPDFETLRAGVYRVFKAVQASTPIKTRRECLRWARQQGHIILKEFNLVRSLSELPREYRPILMAVAHDLADKHFPAAPLNSKIMAIRRNTLAETCDSW